ncbi:Zn-dependent protease with chaperone function [Kutzneria buriramensis]|uniref:Zn-dependent protease with chaperone function n=1 Tax=Kutzneria buriramensis TaxID=1045776 RepID=A0A3E0GZT3_9PSEU|nr:Zn-dependent protease with chaperone function [Kutzneria buriramensis]
MRFPGISPRAYEHPADRGALASLRMVPGFAQVLRAVNGAFSERSERLASLATSIRVGPQAYPALDRIRNECAEILDVDPAPELFIERNPEANAMTIGLDQPFIIVTTGLVEALDTESLRFTIGHEIGHALSGHALYRTMLLRLIRLLASMSWMPVGYWGLRAIIAALKEWYRKAELSADRAGLLCVQNPETALRFHVLLAGAVDASEVDTEAFLAQASDYESEGDVRDSVLKLLNVMKGTHPLAAVRAAEIKKWAESDEYRDILAGTYPLRTEDPHNQWADDVKSAARSYRDAFVETTDPLAKVLNEVGGVVSEAAGKLWAKFTARPEQPPADQPPADQPPADEPPTDEAPTDGEAPQDKRP